MIILLLACSAGTSDSELSPCAQTCAYLRSDCDAETLADKWYDCETSANEHECYNRDPYEDCVAACDRVDHPQAWSDCVDEAQQINAGLDPAEMCSNVLGDCGYSPCDEQFALMYPGAGCSEE